MTNFLLDPFVSNLLGPMKNRLVMSAMTRGFADEEHCCTPEIANYYERRALGGVALILTEGIVIHPSADGYKNVPHLHTTQQSDTWRQTTDKVHAAGSKIFAQLWHCGRISHSDFTGGLAPVSSTNRPAEGLNRQNNAPFGTPRALAANDIPEIFNMYINAAHNAFAAGFDGIQIHMGHGYLIDQFLDSRVNDRLDRYGGSVENRCRIAIELCEALIDIFGPEKVMVRISPSRMMNGLYEWPEMDGMLEHLIPEFDRVGLRQLDISCADANYFETSGKVIRKIRKFWPYFLIGGASLTAASASDEIRDGYLDMVTWGRYILANPDFAQKIRNGEEPKKMTGEMRAILI